MTSGYHECGQGIVSTQCLHYVLHGSEQHQGTISEAEALSQLTGCIVLHASERHQGTIGEPEGLSQVDGCIVFYMRLSVIRVP